MGGFERFLKLLKLLFWWGPFWISRVQKNGAEAKAEVLTDPREILTGLGGYEGEDKWVDFAGRVEPGDGAPFEARIKCKLSQAFLGDITPGMKVRVKYDPADKSRVVLTDDVQTLIQYRIKR